MNIQPLVLIKSFGKEKCVDIINGLLDANGDSTMGSMSICLDAHDLKVHQLYISTRYYETTVLLFECDDLNSIPEEIRKRIEGSIFYFDLNDVHFLSEVQNLVKFVRDNNVSVSTLITRNLNGRSLHGTSYDELKNICKLNLSIIDLNAKSDNGEAVGYAEVLELLKNHVWSTVDISIHNSNKINKLDEDADIEEALNEFEQLLNRFKEFKNVSQTMSREEILQNAESLAELFANMLNED